MPVLEVLEMNVFLGNGSVWYAVLIGVGLPAPCAVGVLNPVVPLPCSWWRPTSTCPCAGPWTRTLPSDRGGASSWVGARSSW